MIYLLRCDRCTVLFSLSSFSLENTEIVSSSTDHLRSVSFLEKTTDKGTHVSRRPLEARSSKGESTDTWQKRQRQLNISKWSGIKLVFAQREAFPCPPACLSLISLYLSPFSLYASFLNRRVIRFRSTTRLRFVRLFGPSPAWNNFVKGFRSSLGRDCTRCI